MMSMLRVRELYSYYGAGAILQGVNFEIGEGEVVGLVGRNGVGKTTLLRTLMGLTDRATGVIEFEGRDIVHVPTYRRAVLGIGYTPQGREIIGTFSVAENLRIGTFARRDGDRSIPSLIYDVFPTLKEIYHRRAGDLSGGQQQQLAIGRALCADPRLLLLDEPTEGIQPNLVEVIGTAIRRLNSEMKLTILLVEQKIDFVRQVCSKFLLMDKGCIVAGGEVNALSDDLVREYMTV